jgi:hypothetical protein
MVVNKTNNKNKNNKPLVAESDVFLAVLIEDWPVYRSHSPSIPLSGAHSTAVSWRIHCLNEMLEKSKKDKFGHAEPETNFHPGQQK